MRTNNGGKIKILVLLLGGGIWLGKTYYKYRLDKKRDKEKCASRKELVDYKQQKELETHKMKLKMTRKAKETELQLKNSNNAETENIAIPTPIEESPNEILEKQPIVPIEQGLFIESVLRNRGVNWFTSRTGQGKSTIAAQLGIEAASGEISKLLPPGKGQTFPPMNICLYDVEHNDDDILSRYFQQGFTFPETFTRVTDCEFPNVELLLDDIRNRTLSHDSECGVIIDNITSLCPTLQADKIKIFNSGLRKIQHEAVLHGFNVTFLIVVHTAKGETWDPITENSLAGSLQMSRSATSLFALEPTRMGDDFKMLKIVKCRNRKKSEYVSIVKIVEEPYLHFEYVNEMKEVDALPSKPKAKKNADAGERKKVKKKITEEDVAEIKKKRAKGQTVKEIAGDYEVSPKTIYTKLKL